MIRYFLIKGERGALSLWRATPLYAAHSGVRLGEAYSRVCWIKKPRKEK